MTGGRVNLLEEKPLAYGVFVKNDGNIWRGRKERMYSFRYVRIGGSFLAF